MREAREQYTQLVQRYSSDLYRFAYWLCGEQAQAQDLVQETFTRGWRARAQLRDPDAAKSWLFTTLRREHARSFRPVAEKPLPLRDDYLPHPQRTFDDSIEALVLRNALAELALDYREPLLMQVLGGFSSQDIGAALGLSESAVNVRLYRARRLLRERIGTGVSSQPRVTQP